MDISHFEQIPLVIRDESASLTVELPEPNTLWADDQEIEATRYFIASVARVKYIL